jgi:hypothetical protein
MITDDFRISLKTDVLDISYTFPSQYTPWTGKRISKRDGKKTTLDTTKQPKEKLLSQTY